MNQKIKKYIRHSINNLECAHSRIHCFTTDLEMHSLHQNPYSLNEKL